MEKSTLTNKFNDVNENNIIDIIKEAQNQIQTLFEYEDVSGFYIVEWRINFHNAYDYIVTNYPKADRNQMLNDFVENFENSTDILYKRLKIE